MPSFTMKKRYWALLALLLLVALDWYIRAPDARSRALSEVIEAQASAPLKNYPYRFRILRVDGATALMGTPRNVQVPAFRALAVLYPKIDTRNANDPQFIAAERLLGEVQAEARAIVLAQPGIAEVRWVLDRDWLVAHGIDVPR